MQPGGLAFDSWKVTKGRAIATTVLEGAMASWSVRKIDDGVYERLKARAPEHRVSTEEEVRRILRQAVSAPERLGELAVRLFGADRREEA